MIGSDVDQMRRSNALFLLKLKEQRRISQVAIDDVVAGSRNLVSQTIQHIHAGVRAKLAQEGFDQELIDGLNDIFENCPDPFYNLGTSYYQEKYYREELGLVVSSQLMHVIAIVFSSQGLIPDTHVQSGHQFLWVKF